MKTERRINGSGEKGDDLSKVNNEIIWLRMRIEKKMYCFFVVYMNETKKEYREGIVEEKKKCVCVV